MITGDETEERYPGEHESLSRFLQGLEPALSEIVGEHNMLVHAVTRALRHRRLAHLRHARDLFNTLPKDCRDRLSVQLIERNDRPEDDDREANLSELFENELGDVICFEAFSDKPNVEVGMTRSDVSDNSLNAGDISVEIKSGTLPSFAASKLRMIAGNIESNKKILSDRYWQEPTSRSKEEHKKDSSN